MSIEDSIHINPRYVIAALLLCVCFLVGSVGFVHYMQVENEKERKEYLWDNSKQKQITLQKQVLGDIQTLEVIAECAFPIFGEKQTHTKQFNSVLKKINNNNAFIRMGLADITGDVVFYDNGGKVNKKINLSGQEFFQRSLKGESSISNAVQDPLEKNKQINYYGVPVRDDANKIVGILCAVNTAEMISDIISESIFEEQGFTNLIDSYGNYVLWGTGSVAQQVHVRNIDEIDFYSNEQMELLKVTLSLQKKLELTYDFEGNEYLMAVEPVGVNGWSILSVIPKEVLADRYSTMALGAGILISLALAIFIFLLYNQYRVLSKSKKELVELAYVDPLTGGRNYSKFNLDAKGFIRGHDKFAIWACDLKNFKYINEIFGYKGGNFVLECFSIEIDACLRERQGLFCHVAADEFAGIIEYCEKEELVQWFVEVNDCAKKAVNRLTEKLSLPLFMGFYCVDEPADRVAIADMVNRAILAQKTVKDLQNKQIAFYDRTIRERTMQKSKLEAEGKSAIENGEFVMYFQPKVNIQRENQIVGIEVLARWDHPEDGLISPATFISTFEEEGLIVDLDRYIYKEACKWLRRHLDSGHDPLIVAINVSRVGLLKSDFIAYYCKIKDEYQIPDQLLELEITESAVLDDDGVIYSIIHEVQSKGFTCSLDDFGSGYSSLNTLKKLYVDIVKLDLGLFKKDADLSRTRIVITNIINMAEDLDIKTVAEGVEDLETVAFLRGSGCDTVQGFVFAKPMSVETFNQLLKDVEGKGLVPKDC